MKYGLLALFLLSSTAAHAGSMTLLGTGRSGGSSCSAGTATYVQGASHQNGATTNTTVTATFGSAVANCDSMFVTVGYAGGIQSGMTCSDSAGNTYTPIGQKANITSGLSMNTFWRPAMTGTPTAIICTLTTTEPYVSIIADDISGLGAATLDQSAMNAQNSPGNLADQVTSGSVTTTAADFVYGAGVSINGSGFNAYGTGFTGHLGVASEYYSETLVQGSAGAVAATFKAVSSTDNTVAAVTAITPH